MNKFIIIICMLSCAKNKNDNNVYKKQFEGDIQPSVLSCAKNKNDNNVYKKQFESDIQPMIKEKLTQKSIDKIKSIWIEILEKFSSKLNEYDFTSKEKEDILKDHYETMKEDFLHNLNVEYTIDEQDTEVLELLPSKISDPRVLDKIFISYLEVEKIINNDPKYKAK